VKNQFTRYFTLYSAHFDIKYKIVNYMHDGAPGYFLYNVKLPFYASLCH